MKIVIAFVVVGSVVFIGAYYVLVRHYYWGPRKIKEKAKEE